MTVLAEDWHLRFWDRTRAGYAAMCTDQECLGAVVIERRPPYPAPDGTWWWSHGQLGEDPTAGGGPFDHWQEAAQAAVESGLARPRR